jgi:DNA-binding NarL/FixJ family response regulator
VIVLTTCSSPDYVESVLDAGAFACVLKTAHPEDLASTVRQTIRKSVYLSRAPARKTAPPLSVAALPLPDMLTRRELEILRLVAEGHSNAKLANMLWVTEQTVKFHLSNIYRKIGVANRTEAGRWAQLHGVLSGSLPSSTHVA